jgi:hypothetical protein
MLAAYRFNGKQKTLALGVYHSRAAALASVQQRQRCLMSSSSIAIGLKCSWRTSTAGIRGIYNAADCLPGRRDMMRWWGNFVDGTLAKQKFAPLRASIDLPDALSGTETEHRQSSVIGRALNKSVKRAVKLWGQSS